MAYDDRFAGRPKVKRRTAPKSAEQLAAEEAAYNRRNGYTSGGYDDYGSMSYSPSSRGISWGSEDGSWGGSIGWGGGGSYESELNRWLEQQRAAAEAAKQAAINQWNAQKPGINQTAEDAARQAYINRQQAGRNLPQQLAATGQSGGLTESALLGLDTTYQNNQANIERDRQDAIRQVDLGIANAGQEAAYQQAQIEAQFAQMMAQQAAERQRAQMEYAMQVEMMQMQLAAEQEAARWQAQRNRDDWLYQFQLENEEWQRRAELERQWALADKGYSGYGGSSGGYSGGYSSGSGSRYSPNIDYDSIMSSAIRGGITAGLGSIPGIGGALSSAFSGASRAPSRPSSSSSSRTSYGFNLPSPGSWTNSNPYVNRNPVVKKSSSSTTRKKVKRK